MPAAMSTPTTFDVETLRLRKSPSGTSGEATRDSITRKTAMSAADKPSMPSVWTEVHPSAREDEAEDAHRLRAVGLLGEEQHEQRQRYGGDDRPADALNGSSDDQGLLRVREPAGERRGGGEREADEEQPAVAEQGAEPAAP